MNIRLLTIKTNSIESLRAFYELLGLHFIKQQHEGGPEHYFSDDMGFPFEIYPTKEPVKNHIAVGLSVLNMGEVKERLIQNGFECSEKQATDYGTFFVTRDPEDNRVEVYE